MKVEIQIAKKDMKKLMEYFISCIEKHDDSYPCWGRCCDSKRGSLMFKLKGQDYVQDYHISDISVEEVESVKYTTSSGKGKYEFYSDGRITFEGSRNSFGKTELFDMITTRPFSILFPYSRIEKVAFKKFEIFNFRADIKVEETKKQ